MKKRIFSLMMSLVIMCSLVPTQSSEAGQSSSQPVKNIIVKKIKNSSIGGTWRYFFRLENPPNQVGSVKVNIHYSCPAIKENIFRSPTVELTGGTYTVFYVDSSVAPYHLGTHGEYGIQKFHIKVLKSGQTIYSCEIPVTHKYEDATD